MRFGLFDRQAAVEEAILKMLESEGPMSEQDIMSSAILEYIPDVVGIDQGSMRSALATLQEKKLIQLSGGCYAITVGGIRHLQKRETRETGGNRVNRVRTRRIPAEALQGVA